MAIATAGSPVGTNPNPADFTFRVTAYLEKRMLETLEYNLRFHQFAVTKSVPAKGTQFARFYRAAKATRTAVNLQEGVTVNNLSTVGVGHVDCYLIQRGDDFQISDIADAVDVLDTLDIYVKNIGGLNVALDYDSIMQASLIGNAGTTAQANALGLGAAQTTLYGSNALYGTGFFERFAGVVNSGNSGNDFATLSGLSPANGKITRQENLRAVTQLRANDIMPPDGEMYPALVAPQIIYDLRQDGTLVGSMQYRNNDLLYKWEKFTLDGAAFIEQTNPWRENAYGTNVGPTAGSVFSNLYLGKEAYGTVMISDKRPGGSPASPKMVILDKPDKSDPKNQRIVGAYKSYFGSIMYLTSDPTDVPRAVDLRCQTTFQ